MRFEATTSRSGPKYKHPQDVISSFLAECYEAEFHVRVVARDMYAHYVEWLSGDPPESPSAFSHYLKRLDAVEIRVESGVRYYYGIRPLGSGEAR